MIFLQFLKWMFLPLLLLHIQTLSYSNLIANEIMNTASVMYMMQNTNMGKRFFVAVPQNDTKNGANDELLSFYICSFTDTRVKFLHHGLNVERNRNIKAFEPMIISTDKGDATFSWEITESEVIGTHGIEITADDPIAVYVLNSRVASSDGYLAIPTEGWGSKYIHCGYYDHRETTLRRGGGFIILSAHNGTNVSIELKGTGEEFGQTVGGRKIGTTININLRQGETYMVRGDASTSQGFDLSGTVITSSNPIGVISFHQRTMIPNQCPNGRDHLSEMLMPVQSWGTEFVTLAFDRGSQGDYIRIIASADNTRVQGTSYQSGSGNILEYFDKTLKAGEFFEHLNSSCPNNNRQNGVRGVTHWKTTKPAMLMQYAYSFPWDGHQNWDPLMILIPPVEQFKRSVVFQPAVQSLFITNQLTFFAIGNPDDPDKKLLNSIYLNDQKMTKKYQTYLFNRVPATNIFWGKTNITQEVQSITSNTKLAGYINGFSGYNSYGWPFLVGTDKRDQLDTLPPEIQIQSVNCGNYTINAYEQRSSYKDAIPQIDQGIRTIMLFKEISSNYSLELNKPANFIPEKGCYEQKFFLNVIDPQIDAKAYFGVVDRAGNYVIDSVYYDAPHLSTNVTEIEFGKIRQNTNSTLDLIVTNTKNDSILLNVIKLKKSNVFKISEIKPNSSSIKLNSNESATITLEFTPNAELNFQDSLLIESVCYKIALNVTGTGVLPKISVDDWFAGNIEVGRRICYEDIYGQGFRITNPGSAPLLIHGFEGIEEPFSISEPTTPPLPIQISPGKEIFLQSICFHPQDTGSYTNTVIIKSNAGNEDTISVWRASAYTKVFVEDYEDNIFNFKIVPNPVTDGLLSIQFETNTKAEVVLELFDHLNKYSEKIFAQNLSEGNHKFEFKTSHLSSGLYFIALKINGKKLVQRVIIIN